MRNFYKVGISASTLIFIVLIGTLVYHNLEGWGYIDSFYFSGITVLTIGYGDFYPTTSLSKIFTVFFAIVGISVGLATLSFIGQYIMDRKKVTEERLQRELNKVVEKHKQRTIDRKSKIIEGSNIS